jgi:hypothetical protein
MAPPGDVVVPSACQLRISFGGEQRVRSTGYVNGAQSDSAQTVLGKANYLASIRQINNAASRKPMHSHDFDWPDSRQAERVSK